MGIVNTTDSNFDNEVQLAGAVLVDLWAPWCNPCLALAPHLDRLAETTGDNLKIVKINVDENPEVMKKFGVRGIPTLIFMVGGKEEGRLVGTSANRLNVTVEKWMNDRGLAFAAAANGADVTDAGTQLEAQAEAATLRHWSSFGGDAAIKEHSLSRLAAIADPEQMPSRQLADSAEQFEYQLGLPAQIAPLLDLVWGMNFAFELQPFEKMREDMLALVRAIPVGGDLSNAPKELQYHAAHLSKWAAIHYPMSAEATAALQEARALHDRERAGGSVPQSTWTTLQKRVILLPDSSDSGKLSEALESLCMPLAGENFMATLSTLLNLAQGDVRRAPHWTEADARRAYESDLAFYATIETTLGPRPTTGDTEIAAWKQAFDSRMETANREKRAADPVFWDRSDHYRNVLKGIQQDLLAYLYTQMLTLFAAASR